MGQINWLVQFWQIDVGKWRRKNEEKNYYYENFSKYKDLLCGFKNAKKSDK